MPSSRAASSRVPVPITWVRAKASWSSIERSTWDSAAKLTTASLPAIASRTTPGGEIRPPIAPRAPGPRVPDLPPDQLDPVGQVLRPAGVGELVEHGDLVLVAGNPDVGG